MGLVGLYVGLVGLYWKPSGRSLMESSSEVDVPEESVSDWYEFLSERYDPVSEWQDGD